MKETIDAQNGGQRLLAAVTPATYDRMAALCRNRKCRTARLELARRAALRGSSNRTAAVFPVGLLNEVVEPVQADGSTSHGDENAGRSANDSPDDQRGTADNHHRNVATGTKPRFSRCRFRGGRRRALNSGDIR